MNVEEQAGFAVHQECAGSATEEDKPQPQGTAHVRRLEDLVEKMRAIAENMVQLAIRLFGSDGVVRVGEPCLKKGPSDDYLSAALGAVRRIESDMAWAKETLDFLLEQFPELNGVPAEE